MNQTPGTTSTVQLPVDLAPSLAERLLRLLDEVTLTCAPDVEFAVPNDRHRCVVCHRSGRHDVVVPAQRRSRYAC